ncbi:hypothetical protein [Kineosporia mesophila]|nr:hypothetical protein [Kineosporia mesophila]MCD5348922.1 hypothetical protein [Kineosporia mesophila]
MPEEKPGGPPAGTGRATAQAWHELLLRVAGTVSDDLISEARGWLAEGQSADVAQALGFFALTGQVPMTAADAALMMNELIADGQEFEALADLELVGPDDTRPLPWVFSPVRIIPDDPPQLVPVTLDLTTEPAEVVHDQIDAAAVVAVAAETTAAGLWRAWRAPIDDAPWPAPRRVFVVSVVADADPDELPRLAARIQLALLAAGEDAPQVEVCQEDRPVPVYQTAACAHAALLWAAEAAHPIQLARVFDTVDPETGPAFDADHPLIEDIPELERLLEYLDAALPVLTSSATMADILDPERPSVVPLTFRTDGHWVWTDTVSYYLEWYGLAPEPDLLEHVRASGELPPPVSDVALHRVLSFLQQSDESEGVWLVPETAGPGRSAVPA